MDKKQMRKTFLQARRTMAPDEADRLSARILKRIWELPEFSEAQSFLIYVASKDNEVSTQPLIRELIASGRTVLVPIARPDGVLAWSRLLDMGELAPARFGILEPRPEVCRPAEPASDALVVVPGVAFTPNGWRIGYGGGFYDRFLADHKGVKIAPAYQMQITPEMDHAPHDVPVDIVVTEANIYRRLA